MAFDEVSYSKAKKVEKRLDQAIESGQNLNGWVEESGKLNTKINNVETKLTTDLAESATFANQENFVQTLMRNTSYTKMQLTVNDIARDIMSVIYSLPNNKAVKYGILRKTLDDYTLLETADYGDLSNSYVVSGVKSYDKTTGTWNTGSGNANYTTQVDASFEATVECAGLDIGFPTDNRGGIFDIIVDGDTANPITISTWANSGTIDYKYVSIFRKDKTAVHSIKGIFRGADPLNPPTGGTARGWLIYDFPARSMKTFQLQQFVSSLLNPTALMVSSNKEFAFEWREKGVGDYQFTPTHSSVNTAHYKVPTKFIVDGVVKTLKNGDVFDIQNEFSIVQRILSANPDNPNNLADITTITKFKKDGTVVIEGKFKALKTIDVKNAYTIMFPVAKPFSEKIKTSIGNTYLTNKSDNSNTSFKPEKDMTTSFIALSNTLPNVGVTVSYNNPKETLRWYQGGKNYPADDVAWINHRDSTFAKFYQRIYRYTEIPAGTELRWSGTFFIGCFEGLYDLF